MVVSITRIYFEILKVPWALGVMAGKKVGEVLLDRRKRVAVSEARSRRWAGPPGAIDRRRGHRPHHRPES